MSGQSAYQETGSSHCPSDYNMTADKGSADHITPGESSKTASVAENASEPPKAPSRIIRLTRPANPFSAAKSEPSTSAAVSNGPVSAGNVTSSAGGSATPGSRLAALQRPGSPMHRILQRAQSPALAAAAARMNRQSVGDSNPSGSNTNEHSTNIHDNATSGVSKEPVVRQSKLGTFTEMKSNTDNGVDRSNNPNSDDGKSAHVQKQEVSQEQRTNVPPRIPASSLSGSILLGRPASPLHSGRQSQSPLINKPTFCQSLDGNSPRSPGTDSQLSPRQTLGTQDENQISERVAIRNKLRANSFKLKDLLTKKPFVRSTDEDGENAADGSAQDKQEHASNNSEDTTSGESKLSQTLGDCPDRTRWRREGPLTLTRSKSTLSERTASLISARYRRTRPQVSADESKAANEQSVVQSTDLPTDALRNGAEKAVSNTTGVKGSVNTETSSTASSNTETGSLGQNRVTVGATLLRSPRTRNQSENSNVPSKIQSNEVNQTEISEKQSEQISSEDRKAKALSDLEKEAEASLVFDSQKMGQLEHLTSNSESGQQVDIGADPDRGRVYARSQSEHQKSESDDDLVKQRINSEPATPQAEQHTVRGSRSCDGGSDGDFSKSSPALKRCLAVTDLDQAMRDRDQEKLSSIFKENMVEAGEEKGQKVALDRRTEGKISFFFLNFKSVFSCNSGTHFTECFHLSCKSCEQYLFFVCLKYDLKK